MTTPNDLPSVGTKDAVKAVTILVQKYASAWAENAIDVADPEWEAVVAAVRALVSERDELASWVRELEANARRYEWLRENNAYSIHDRLFADCPMHKFNDAMLDAAIDAAISAKPDLPDIRVWSQEASDRYRASLPKGAAISAKKGGAV